MGERERKREREFVGTAGRKWLCCSPFSLTSWYIATDVPHGSHKTRKTYTNLVIG